MNAASASATFSASGPVLISMSSVRVGNVVATVANHAPGLEITTALDKTDLSAMGTVQLGFAIVAPEHSASHSTLVLRLTSVEGAQLDIPVDCSRA